MVKSAVIGFGFMGMTHTLNILKNSELQLAAIADKDLEGIQKKLSSGSGNFAVGDIDPQVLDGIHKYASLEQCLDNESLDMVNICVHTDLHYEIARKALKQNKHVFLEKPMCLDINQGEELVDLAREKGLILMVGHVVRFMPQYQQLKKWIESKQFGELRFLSLSRFSGVPVWGQWKEKQKAFGSSGGALFDLVIHDIDFVHYVLGKPDEINCHRMPGYLSEQDYVNAQWKYHDLGITVKIEGGNVFHASFPFQAGFMAQFEQASIFYSTLQPEFIQIADHEKSDKIAAGDANDGFYNEIDYFAACVKNHQDPVECSPESALNTIKLCYEHLI